MVHATIHQGRDICSLFGEEIGRAHDCCREGTEGKGGGGEEEKRKKEKRKKYECRDARIHSIVIREIHA